MATFAVRIDCNNAAFGETDGDAAHEISRILHEIARRVQDAEGFESWETIRDLSGNDVGRFAFKDYPTQGLRKIRSSAI